MRSRLAALAALLLPALAFSAAPPPRPLHERIDALLEATPGFRQHDAGPAADEELFRRAHLDLIGRIPTAGEVRAFLADRTPGKRAALIERLLASPEHARHLATVFDVMLTERRVDTSPRRPEWLAFLFRSFRDNRPWDEIAREALSGDDRDPKQRYRVKFYLDRNAEPNLVVRDVSRLFLGTNLQCAQCHDHPRVEDYKQADYYGLFAFVNRTSLAGRGRGPAGVLTEKADGEVSFQSVFDPKKVTKTSLPRVPGGPPVPDPKGAKGYSRRMQLAGQVARADYMPFRRNIANRLWALMMGRGLVDPLDMDHSNNPPTHPELLDEMAEEMRARRLDVRHLLRQIALSRAYQRSSVPKVEGKDAPLYAVAPLKPLKPEQLAWSLIEATGMAQSQRLALGAKATEEALYARLSPLVPPFVRVFGGEPGTAESFDARLEQALFLANGPTVRSWLADRPGSLVGRLNRLKGDLIAEELYLSVLGRKPDEEERREAADFLKRRPGATADLAWALLASTEFRFNH